MLLDDRLPLRVVFVLDQIDDRVDEFVVNVPLGQNEPFSTMVWLC